VLTRFRTPPAAGIEGFFIEAELMNVNTYPHELAYVFGKLAIAMNKNGVKIYKSDAREIGFILNHTDNQEYKNIAKAVMRIH